jgi:cytochrome oxidase Cu insertion factor (SCO1/SenC/PrrC family)
MSQFKRSTLALVSAAALVALAGGAFLLKQHLQDGQIQSGVGTTTVIGQQIGGSFNMVNQFGQPVTDADFRGRFPVYFFGFTFCPDVCPTELLTLAQVLDSLPDDVSQALVPIFVSVDPARDTPDVMGQYVGQFHPRIVGLTGTPENLADMARKWRVYYAKRGEDEYYTMDHSAFLYLMGPDGAFIDMFPNNVDSEELADKLAALVRPRLKS